MMNNPKAEKNTFRFPSRWPYRLGLTTMFLLLLLAAIFWRERSWMLDVAFQTFLMIKDGTVQVMVYRFGAATVQSLPLLGIKIGVPLAAVSWLYSVSFHLHFLAFFLLAAKLFKREDIALGIALLYTAMTYDGFYWQTSELQQGLGFLLVSWAALLRYPKPEKWGAYIIWLPVVVALAFYHPLVFMPFYLMLIWLWWKPDFVKVGGRQTLIALGGMMLVTLAVKQVWFKNWYDQQKTEQFLGNLQADFPNYFDYPAYGQFLEDAIFHWWGYTLLLIFISGWLILRRQLWGLSLLWLASLGFMLLSAIGDPVAEHRFYVEVNYYPLLTFVLVPIIVEVFPRWRAAGRVVYRNATIVVGLLLFARLALITINAQPYTERVDYLRKLTRTAPAPKVVVDPATLNQKLLKMDWGLCYETLIQSSVELQRSFTLLPLPDPGSRETDLASDSLFVTPWTSFPLEAVNQTGYWNVFYRPYLLAD